MELVLSHKIKERSWHEAQFFMQKIRLIVILDCILAVVLFGFILQQYGSDSVIETAKRSSMKDYEKKYVALTFDDGPNPDYTEILLEGLKERGIKATFFLLGEEVEKYPEIVEKIHRDGHLIGVHSYKHVNLSELSDEAAVEQIDKANEAIHEITGMYSEYIRPPYGCWKCDLDYRTKMIEVLWDVDPKDWASHDAAVVTERVLTKVQDGDVILLHDASKSSVMAAFQIIDALKEKGYEFVTVDELIFE